MTDYVFTEDLASQLDELGPDMHFPDHRETCRLAAERLRQLDKVADRCAYVDSVLALVDAAFQTGAGQRKRIAALKEVRKALAPEDGQDG